MKLEINDDVSPYNMYEKVLYQDLNPLMEKDSLDRVAKILKPELIRFLKEAMQ